MSEEKKRKKRKRRILALSEKALSLKIILYLNHILRPLCCINLKYVFTIYLEYIHNFIRDDLLENYIWWKTPHGEWSGIFKRNQIQGAKVHCLFLFFREFTETEISLNLYFCFNHRLWKCYLPTVCVYMYIYATCNHAYIYKENVFLEGMCSFE